MTNGVLLTIKVGPKENRALGRVNENYSYNQ